MFLTGLNTRYNSGPTRSLERRERHNTIPSHAQTFLKPYEGINEALLTGYERIYSINLKQCSTEHDTSTPD
jgi:hypothetical protein